MMSNYTQIPIKLKANVVYLINCFERCELLGIGACDAQILTVFYEDMQDPCVKGVYFSCFSMIVSFETLCTCFHYVTYNIYYR